MSEDKYCSYCKKTGHWDSECWCTRPIDWKPTLPMISLVDLNKILAPKTEDKPFGYWHVGPTPEECDFFPAHEFGNVGCPTCIPLYTRPKE